MATAVDARPEAANDHSHGWSEAEPVETVNRKPAPEGRRDFRRPAGASGWVMAGDHGFRPPSAGSTRGNTRVTLAGHKRTRVASPGPLSAATGAARGNDRDPDFFSMRDRPPHCRGFLAFSFFGLPAAPHGILRLASSGAFGCTP